jgi:hypothetical protein
MRSTCEASIRMAPSAEEVIDLVAMYSLLLTPFSDFGRTGDQSKPKLEGPTVSICDL